LIGALNALTHCALSIDQPTETESLSHISLQLFRPIRSMFQCKTRACSPTRVLYYTIAAYKATCMIIHLCAQICQKISKFPFGLQQIKKRRVHPYTYFSSRLCFQIISLALKRLSQYPYKCLRT